MLFEEYNDFATCALPGVTWLDSPCAVSEVGPASLAAD
jgi:hypothetical protein